MAAACALWALAALAAVAGGAATPLTPVPVYFGDAACNGAAGGVTLCRGGTLGAPVTAGGVTSYPNKSGGSPLWINGVVTQLDAVSMQTLAGYGAQSIRTYTAVGGPAVLSMAMQYAPTLTVTMGLAIPIAAGSGTTYTTASGIAALITSLQPLVQACQNYPNLLFWMIGNEVEDPPYQGFGPIFAFMNQLAALIHEWDPYHPVGTATPDINAATLYSLNALAPNLDVLGSNVYGAAMASNILVGANTAPSAANKLTVTLPLGAAGTAYEVVPVYPNAIFGGCCTGSAATCSISGVTGATGAAISTPFANASCIWAKPGAGGALGTGPLKPFFLSELGPDNWWQVAQTPYGDWLEATSTQKAAVYSKNWQVAVAMGSTAYTNIPALLGGRGGGMLGGACVGAYAFSYGWVWQASATWINMLNNYNYTWNPAYGGAMAGGEEIEPIDMLTTLWGGPRAANHAPYISIGLRINGMTSDMNVQVQVGTVASAAVSAVDPDGDALTYTWLVLPMPSAPTDHNTPAPVSFNKLSATGGSMKFSPPSSPGYYRLTVWVSDGKGKAATHSMPFEATLLPGGVSAYAQADTYVQDGELSGGSYGAGSTNFGAAPFLAALWNGVPRNAPGAPGPGYGLGNNAFPYVAFGVPDSWGPAGATPDRVVAAFFVQGGAPLNNIGTQQTVCASTGDGTCTGYFLYATPATWAEASVTWASSPCTGGTPPSTNGVGACAASGPAGFMTASYDVPLPLVLPFQAPGAAQPPGLQMNGQYLYFDITAQAAPLIAAGTTKLSYMLLGAGPASRVTFFTSQEAHPASQNGPFLTLWPPAAGALVSTTMSVSGTTAMTPAAIATMQASVAATMPGVTASQVAVSVVGGQVTTSVVLSAAQVAAFTPAAQAAWAAGLAADAGVQPSNLVVSAPVPPPAGRRHLLQAGAMEVPVTIVGFPPADATSGVPHDSTSDASTAIVQALSGGDSTSAASAALVSAGVPGGVSLAEPPATWHHVSVATPPGAPGADHAAGAALLQANVANGGLAAELGRRGMASDVGAAGSFMRPSAELRSLNPFEGYRNGADGSGGLGPAPAPAPSIVMVTEVVRSAEAHTAFILAIASICVAGVALCLAAGALLHVVLARRHGAGGAAPAISAGKIPSMALNDVEAPPAKSPSRRTARPPAASTGGGGEPLAASRERARDARTYNEGHRAPR